jgi:hypothetical protein
MGRAVYLYPSPRKAEVGGLGDWGQPGIQSKTLSQKEKKRKDTKAKQKQKQNKPDVVTFQNLKKTQGSFLLEISVDM